MTITQSSLDLARLCFNTLSREVYANNVKVGWFKDPKTGRELNVDPLQKLMLMVTEISECAEGVRKDIMDDHIPTRKSEEVELADLLIRVFEYAGWRGLDLGGALVEKVAYNAIRADHQLANRKLPGGKQC